MSQFFARRDLFERNSSGNGSLLAVTRKTMDCTDINATTQFHAQRTLKDLIVSIRLDAGEGQVSQDHVEVALGKKFGELPEASHSSLRFGGWYTDPIGGTIIASDTIVTYDIQVLYAHYISQSYTVDLNGQWFLDNRSGTDPNGNAYGISYSTNPDANEYDGTYISYSNFNVDNGFAKMRINFIGYSEFVVYIRSYAESNYDYTIAGKIDQSITSNIDYTNALAYQHTRGYQTSGTEISNYTKVTYSNLDGGQHFIDIIYRKDGSSHMNQDRGYVLIPKNK